jgi:hypothetical protein
MKKSTPLHILLKRFRVIYVTVTAFFLWLGISAWLWFQLHYLTMSAEAAAAFSAIYLAIIGGLKYVLENSRQDDAHDKDDKEE